MSLPVAILAGGLATRLRPLTEQVPKSLLEVAGKPFVVRQLELLRANAIERVVMCVGHLGGMIEREIGTGEQWGLSISYSFDGDRLLGTGGALKRALAQLGDHFFVLYGDSYLDCDYAAVADSFQASGKPALMTVYRNDGRWDRSNVLFEEKRIVAYDKINPTQRMHHIDYGLGVLSSEVFDNSPGERPFDLATVYQELASRGELAGFEVGRRFYEIGSSTGLEEAQEYFGRKEKAQ